MTKTTWPAIVQLQLATQQSIKAYVDGQTGAEIDAGAPTDGSWSTGGAYQGFANTDKVVNVLDDLNEIIENVRSNTFVRSVTFVANTTAGGAGTTVTLTTTVDGNANQFVVDWGDGNTDTTSDSTPSHTYTSNSGSPFTVTVTASNTSGAGIFRGRIAPSQRPGVSSHRQQFAAAGPSVSWRQPYAFAPDQPTSNSSGRSFRQGGWLPPPKKKRLGYQSSFV